MQGLISALSLLTSFPVGRLAREDGSSQAALYFPFVGVLIGASLALAFWIGAKVDPWLAALLAVCWWFVATGAMHADGLADLSDALMAAHGDRNRFSEVLKDPHIGSFGALALVLLVVAKMILVMLLAKSMSSYWALILLPAWARWSAMIWLDVLPPIHEGMASRHHSVIKRKHLILWIASLSVATFYASPILLSAIPITWIGSVLFRRMLGGICGDALGAGIEVSEVVLLLTLVFYSGVTHH